MNLISTGKATAIACSLIAAVACNNADRARTDTGSPAAHDSAAARTEPTSKSASDTKPAVTLTGCLQRGDGSNSFILTRVNEPTQSVGTSGNDNGRVVEREQLRATSNAYALNPQGDVKLDDLVGKQVRISGTMAQRADLPVSDGNADRDRNNALKIDQGDLAKVDVTSAAAMAGACGEHPKGKR